MAFKIGSGFIVAGAVLFMAAFFVPENGAAALAPLGDMGNNAERAVGLDISYRNNDPDPPAESPSVEYVSEPMTDEEIMKRAEELGMVFENAEEAAYRLSENLDIAHIIIRTGASAYEVAYMLEAAGVVDSADGFARFIVSADVARSINAGEYYIETGLDYSGVLRIISTTYRLRSN